MTELPKVFVPAAAKATGKLSVLKEMYRDAVARGEHVHWNMKTQRICRNGTSACPFWKEEE